MAQNLTVSRQNCFFFFKPPTVNRNPSLRGDYDDDHVDDGDEDDDDEDDDDDDNDYDDNNNNNNKSVTYHFITTK